MCCTSERVPSAVKDLRACAVASVSTERSGHLWGPHGHPSTSKCTFSHVHVAVCRLCGPVFNPLGCDAFI